MWFGSLSQFRAWKPWPFVAKLSAYAETYENQVVLGAGNWVTKGLSRPTFSDVNGMFNLSKVNFDPPSGWEWVGDWFIAPDFRYSYFAVLRRQPHLSALIENKMGYGATIQLFLGEDFGLSSYRDEVYEVQTIETGDDWSDPKIFWMNGEHVVLCKTGLLTRGCFTQRMEQTTARDDIDLPEGWEITSDWAVDTSTPGDVDGYQYAPDPDSNDYCSSGKSYHLCRRRLWLRSRVKVREAAIPTIKDAVKETGGWEYAKMFTTKFHSGEGGSDIVRRRKHRRQIDVVEGLNFEPVVFTMSDKGKKIKVPPQVIMTFPERNMFEARVHIYTGRALTSPEVSGYTNTYCTVCVARQTQNTITIWQQLSPCWDQTLVFRGIPIVGDILDAKSALPQITINVFHRGPLVSIFHHG
eukprot:sb/3465212/